MPASTTYLFVNLSALLVPLVFSFHPRIRFYREWQVLFPAMFLTAFVFLVWDALFTRLGVWHFNPDYLLGPSWFGLPLEEYLFFLCIPYASLFLFHVMKHTLLANVQGGNRFSSAVWVTALLLATLAAWNYDRLYTVSAFLSAALALGAACHFRFPGLAAFLVSYLIILVPFFAVNGVLTGSFLDRQVVGYNDAENLGLRILTIPVEDVFYGFSLLLWIQVLAEILRNKIAGTRMSNETSIFI